MRLCKNGHDKEVVGTSKGWCKVCQAESARKRRATFPDICREQSRRSHYKHKIKRNAESRITSKAYYHRNKHIITDERYRKLYGITLDEYRAMEAAQNFCCDICRTHVSLLDKKLAVDHDHETGKVRALLCGNCNLAIGLLKEDPTLLNEAVSYLVRHGKKQKHEQCA